jgi:membrane protein
MIVLTLLIPNIGYKLLLWIQNNLFVYFNVDLLSFFSWGRNILLLGLYILLFGTIYSKLPNRRIKLKDAYYGAIFALVGTIIENIVFSNIVVKLTDYTVLYGSLSVVIAFMVWLYIWGIIIMTGAEINAMIWERREQMMGEDAHPTAVGKD